MSISNALFSGISGLTTLGNSMAVVGDNIANVNTVGFKNSRATFQDVLAQNVATAAGTSQIGRGVRLGTIVRSFEQGSFESTSSPTDLAIGGDGFFMLRDPNTEGEVYYTRSGEFRFDKDGNFINPSGYVVQGWEMSEETGEDVGTVGDLVLSSFTSPPEETSKITAIVNLDSDEESNADGSNYALSRSWDGSDADGDEIYMPTNSYEYQTSVKAYDSLGSIHDITIFYDKGENANEWEYAIAGDPGEDNRTYVSSTDQGVGMLARGLITFNNAGRITDMTMDRFVGDSYTAGTVTDGGAWTGTASLPSVSGIYAGSDAAPPAAQSWTIPAGGMTLDGSNPAYTLACTGDLDDITIPANYTAGTPITLTEPSGDDTGMTIAFESGTYTAAESFDFTITQGDADDLTNVYSWDTQLPGNTTNTNGYFSFTPSFTTGTAMNISLNIGTSYTGSDWQYDSLSTTQYSSSSNTVFSSSNGYGAGDLEDIDVSVDGTIAGSYSNGQVLNLFRVALAKFNNEQGLSKIGNNLYAETREAGDHISGKPQTIGLGSISPNSLEQSNVDIAEEFVKMITTQRGFQANSKIITVSDQMMADLINMKR